MISSFLGGVIFSCKYWKITNNTGITTNPKNVPINKPTAAPVAIERFPTAPIPVAKMRGNKPKINANEVIKILSVKSNIELTSPEEITLNANGSQLKINGSGVFITTTGKFEVKAGQHIFLGGSKADLPKLTWSFKEKSASCMQNASESHEAFVGFES